MHIHHVQFDPQGSDGAIAGMSFEQSIRPYTVEDPELAAAAGAGDSTDQAHERRAKFQRAASGIAVGIGTENIEIHQIASIDAATKTLTLDRAAHATTTPRARAPAPSSSSTAGTPTSQLDNIFWHDHVDGIHGWGQGLVGQLIIEPEGSTYHDPTTGEQVDSGHDRRHPSPTNPLAPGLGHRLLPRDGALDDRRQPDHRLDAQPARRRRSATAGGTRSVAAVLSSYKSRRPEHAAAAGLPRRPVRDPDDQRRATAIDTLHLDGHRFYDENRITDGNGKPSQRRRPTPSTTASPSATRRSSTGGAGGAGQRGRLPVQERHWHGASARARGASSA